MYYSKQKSDATYMLSSRRTSIHRLLDAHASTINAMGAESLSHEDNVPSALGSSEMTGLLAERESARYGASIKAAHGEEALLGLLHPQPKFVRLSRNRSTKRVAFLAIAAFLIGLFLLVSWSSGIVGRSRSEGEEGSLDFPKRTLTNATFGGLAQSLLPAAYQATLDAVHSSLTKTVEPAQVSRTRKLILTARDLLDVFSPVYPNATGAHGADLWSLLRVQLDRGYTIVGDFVDLNHAHVNYTRSQMIAARHNILQWKRGFDDFGSRNAMPAYLRAIDTTTEGGPSFTHEKESRLFWKHAERRPRGGDDPTAALRSLARKQLQLSLDYYNRAYVHDAVMGSAEHDDYQYVRRAKIHITCVPHTTQASYLCL